MTQYTLVYMITYGQPAGSGKLGILVMNLQLFSESRTCSLFESPAEQMRDQKIEDVKLGFRPFQTRSI